MLAPKRLSRLTKRLRVFEQGCEMLKSGLVATAIFVVAAPAQAGVIYAESGTMQSPGRYGGQYFFPLHAGSTITARWDLSNDAVSIDGFFHYRATGPGADVSGDYTIQRISPTVYQVVAQITPAGTNFFNGGELNWSAFPLRFDPQTLDWGPVDYRLTVFDSSVPEPGSWALMIAGFSLAGAALRRRRLTVFA